MVIGYVIVFNMAMHRVLKQIFFKIFQVIFLKYFISMKKIKLLFYLKLYSHELAS